MSRRNLAALGAVVLVFAISQVASAQVNPKGAAPGSQPQGDLTVAAQPNGATWQDVIEELRQLRSEVQTLQSNVGAMQQNMVAIQDGFEKQITINDTLEKQVADLSEGLKKAAAGGTGILSAKAMEDDPQLAKDFQKVVQGKVIFDNQTGEVQRIFINGAEWEVITGRSSMLVPYGQVTFHTRATNDGTLTQFNADNWTQVGGQFVLNVPLQPTPQADR